MNNYDDLFNLIKDDLKKVKYNIQKISENETDYSSDISDRLSYVLSSTGKQLRPAITLVCSNLFEERENSNSLKMATAVELLHIATLIHDDTVDSADVRRGKATASSIWGGNIAVLLGDYLFATSGVFVSEIGNVELDKRFAETIVELSKGELIENIDSFNFKLTKEKYFSKTYLKTASLFRTASYSGAVVGGADNEMVKQISDFGCHFGMGYQIQDDILDFTSNETDEGKPVFNDLSEGIITLPIINYIESKKMNQEVKHLLSLSSKIPSELKLKIQEEIRNSDAIQKSIDSANYHYEKAIDSLKNVPKSKYKNTLLDIVNYSRKRA